MLVAGERFAAPCPYGLVDQVVGDFRASPDATEAYLAVYGQETVGRS